MDHALEPEIPPPLPMRRFSVDEYLRMHELDILTEDDRCELLEGWIVPKNGQESTARGLPGIER